MTLKWKRSGAGVYRCGRWVIRGTSSWDLYRQVDGKEKFIITLGTKKACQQHAEKHPDAGLPKPTKPKQAIPDNDNLGSVLASFRLEVCRLTDMVGLLATEIRELRQGKGDGR